MRLSTKATFLICAVLLDLSSCQICNKDDPESGGLLIPAFSTGGAKGNTTTGVFPESDPQAMAVLYLILLLWMFLGVGIIADVFMSAIEVITSQSTIREIDGGNNETIQVEVKFWNPTVANLTLMALGSSAPEILLSIIEILSNEMFSGALGPSTILGSAAFNLLVISAVCVVAVPSTETRKIEELGVFFVTATFSLLSYIWLYIIIVPSTEDIVDLWEACVTLAMFPVLIVLAYMADKGYFHNLFGGRGEPSTPRTAAGPTSDNDDALLSNGDVEMGAVGGPAQITGVEISDQKGKGKKFQFQAFQVAKLLKGSNAKNLTPDEAAQVVMGKLQRSEKHSRAWHRINATHIMAGKKPIIVDPLPEKNVEPGEEQRAIGFECTKMKVPESIGTMKVGVKRFGPLDGEVSVKYQTVGGTATADEDFKSAVGVLTFADGQDLTTVSVEIIDDDIPEDDEVFTIELSDCTSDDYKLTRSVVAVTILDNDQPGKLQFSKNGDGDTSVEYTVFEDCGFASVRVERVGGSRGVVSCQYRTVEGSAKPVTDYDHTTGVLEFAHGEIEKYIDIKIIDDEGYELKEQFSVELHDGQDCEIGGLFRAIVWIEDADAMKRITDQAVSLLKLNLHHYEIGTTSWKEQFTDAVSMPEEGTGVAMKILHFVSMPFKVVFAATPPTSYGGGWATFCVALAFIGLVTAVIGDLAGLLGCSLGIKDSVTAITFVALGTSLPDTFASKTAAVMDDTADASIGNIVGSNSVNVLLGLGLPWTVAAAFWEGGIDSNWRSEYPDLFLAGKTGFVVRAGDLGFSVIVFTLVALVCLATLIARRVVFGAELGGQARWPTFALLVTLWFLYVILSTLKTYKEI